MSGDTSNLFTIENIGVNCSQDVSNVLESVFTNLFTADDIPRDRLEAMLHSKETDCLDSDIDDIMRFLDTSQSTFMTHFKNAEVVDRFLSESLERSYTIDSEGFQKRKATIPEQYREKNIPLPPIHSSFKLDETVIRANNLVSPGAIFDHVDELTRAQARRKEQIAQPSTLEQTTSSMLAKKKPRAAEREVKPIKRKPMRLKTIGKGAPDTQNLRPRPPAGPRLLTSTAPFSDPNQACFVSEPKSVQFNEWQLGKVYEESIEIRNISDHSRYFRLLPPRGKHFALGLGQYIAKDNTEIANDASSAHVAPGMSARFVVRFIPDSLQNIQDVILLQCESGQNLEIPINAKRAAPVLTLPENLDLGGCLVGQAKTEVFQVCNVAGAGRFMLITADKWREHVQSGRVPKFSAEVSSPDGVFRIKPGFLALKENEAINIAIQVAPKDVREYKFEVALICDNCNVKYITCAVRGQTAFIENVEVMSKSVQWEKRDPGVNRLKMEFVAIRPENPSTAIIRLDNPCEVDLSFVWIKEKLKLLANKGSGPEVDEISPILVIPNSGTLPSKSTCEFDIVFNPTEIGLWQTLLSLQLIDSVHQTALEIECHGAATGVDVSLETCVIAPPKGSIEIGQTYTDTVILKNNEPQVPIEFSWTSVDGEAGFSKITPNMGTLQPGQELKLEVNTAAHRAGLFEVILNCTIKHVKEPVRLLTRLHVEEPRVKVVEPSIDFGLLRTEGSKEVELTLYNASLISTVQYMIHPRVGNDMTVDGMFDGRLYPEEQRKVTLKLSGVEENLDFGGFIEVHAARAVLAETIDASPGCLPAMRLSTVLPIRGKVTRPKLIPEQSIITIEEAFAPNIIKKVPVLLKNNGLLPVACEFNSFAVDHAPGDEVILTELSCAGGPFEILVLQPGERHELVVFVAWERPAKLHQINLLFNVFAVDAVMDGNTRDGARKASKVSVQPLLIALRAEPKNIMMDVDKSSLTFENVPIGYVASEVVTLENTSCVEAFFTAKLIRFNDSAEINCYVSDEQATVPPGEKFKLTLSVRAQLFGNYNQLLELRMGVQTIQIPVSINITGCPLTLPMFSAGAPRVLRFSKMNTNSISKTRQIKVFNPTSVEMAVSWRLFLTKDIYDIPIVEVFGKSAFLESNDTEAVNLRIFEAPGREIEPMGLFEISPISQAVPAGKDAKFTISCHPKLASENIEASIQAIGYISLLSESDKVQEFVSRSDEYNADTLALQCLASISHIDTRKLSTAKPIDIKADAFSMLNGDTKSILVEAQNTTEFAQTYQVVSGNKNCLENVFISSIKEKGVQIPRGGKLQFHVEPQLNKDHLMKLLDESDSDKITHRYNSFRVANSIEFASSAHKISFPLSLTCHLPEISVSTNDIDFSSVLYGRSAAKEFIITNTSSHCQSWYSLALDNAKAQNFYFNGHESKNRVQRNMHQNGVLRPKEHHRIVVNFSPDGTQLNYTAKITVRETLLDQISTSMSLAGMASFDSKGVE